MPKVLLTYRSLLAGAAEAAAPQGKFWEMHTLLFERQQALQTKDLIRYAGELGLDAERFRNELKHQTYRDRVRADFIAGSPERRVWHPGSVPQWRLLRR
jgi:predicted DsbA family dithiol-disulfide isomerase